VTDKDSKEILNTCLEQFGKRLIDELIEETRRKNAKIKFDIDNAVAKKASDQNWDEFTMSICAAGSVVALAAAVGSILGFFSSVPSGVLAQTPNLEFFFKAVGAATPVVESVTRLMIGAPGLEGGRPKKKTRKRKSRKSRKSRKTKRKSRKGRKGRSRKIKRKHR